MESIKEVFSKNFRETLSRSKFTQKEVSQALGVDPSTLQRWLTMKSWPEAEYLDRLAEVMGVSPLEFFRGPIARTQPTPHEALRVLQDMVDGRIRPQAAGHLPSHLIDGVAALHDPEAVSIITELLDERVPGWREGRLQEVRLNPGKAAPKANK